MAIFNLFSKRQRLLRGEVPDVFIYDKIPNQLRVQIIHIIRDAIGKDRFYRDTTVEDIYETIHNILCREYGIFFLGDDPDKSFQEQVLNFLLKETNNEKAIDAIEVSFQYIDKVIRKNYFSHSQKTGAKIEPEQAIDELNNRFKENGVGYSFESGEILRVDSTYVHNQITKPLLSLLINRRFDGANEEFLKAHEHYRHGRNKECLAECLKSFESTMKIICKEKGWNYNETDTAKKLIQTCFQNNLVPSFTQNQFTSLQNLLESGIPTIRNKLGGHGQGQVPQKVDDEMTRYGLNLTATNIIFLIEQSKIK